MCFYVAGFGLANNDFADGLALAFDQELTCFRVGYADALEVVVFNRSVSVAVGDYIGQTANYRFSLDVVIVGDD